MPPALAADCVIWKAWDPAGQSFGWWYKPPDEPAVPLGLTVLDSLEYIADIHEEQLLYQFDASDPLDSSSGSSSQKGA